MADQLPPTISYELAEEEEYPEFEPAEFKCGHCDRTFDTPQGKAAHERACDAAE